MAVIDATISGGTAPYSIVVRKLGETTGNRCTGDCDSFPVEFTEDTGNHQYYFIVTDSGTPVCTVDSRGLNGGIGSVDCTVTTPNFNAVLVQPTCLPNGQYTVPSINLTSIVNATRYKVCYNTVTMDCAACTVSDGTITGTSMSIPLTINNVPGNTGVLLRVYKDNTCVGYKEFFATIVKPVCTGVDVPDFAAQVEQPYCSTERNGTPQPAVLKLTNIVNATRYKICYNSSTFSCGGDCTSSDGLISGTTATINIPAPAEGIEQVNTIRVFNGAGCTNYKDYTMSAIRSPKCSTNELTQMDLSLLIYPTGEQGFAKCDQPDTYHIAYDMYITPNTPGMSENGTQVRTGSGAQRTLPTGNDVPNIFVAASYKPLCSLSGNESTWPGTNVQSVFHRWVFNLSGMKAKYPLINEFIFDVYALKTKNLPGAYDPNVIRPRINAFTGVKIIKEPYSLGAQDAKRDPLYDGSSCWRQGACGAGNCCPDPYDIFTNTQNTIPDVIYNDAVSGSRKIGTIRYNFTTNKVTWST